MKRWLRENIGALLICCILMFIVSFEIIDLIRYGLWFRLYVLITLILAITIGFFISWVTDIYRKYQDLKDENEYLKKQILKK